jgi:hypothetical protein
MAFPSVLCCAAKAALRMPPGARRKAHPTLPIIGSAPSKWNVFSNFIFIEISIARAANLT